MTINLRRLFDDVDGRLEIDSELKPFSIDEGVVDSIKTKGYIQNFSGRIELYMTVDAVFHTNCSRCMSDVNYPITFEVEDRIFREDGDDEFIHLEGDEFDLKTYVEQEINLNLPIRVLCTDSCKGLCPTCGANLNKQECSCTAEIIDSRLAKLKELLDKKEE